ncbi:CYTH domain-containing protein [Neisseria leonii]|uniref:CYTH domain-containing protein n=1 Tax=Neisseria leonii TaxID=2995413 RepID=A0A9X4E2W0_9NEIS|nr:CYTH domain-containing protein [Neisseria sp. 51.81]MDD9328656.1 CYTH domain-containing protein [Neisseria sp. 51.81]
MDNANIEIERRFLPAHDGWRAVAGTPRLIRQGYLSVDKACTIRVRIIGNRAWLTLKGYLSDVSRSEFEYEIPPADAETMMRTLCPFCLEKHRYEVHEQGHVFEIDEYCGDNAPLVVVELELADENAGYPRPDWLGAEITAHGRYTNAYLSTRPYSVWTAEERAAPADGQGA